MKTIFEWRMQRTAEKLVFKIRSPIIKAGSNTRNHIISDVVEIIKVAEENGGRLIQLPFEQTEWLASEKDTICSFFIKFDDYIDVLCFLEQVRKKNKI